MKHTYKVTCNNHYSYIKEYVLVTAENESDAIDIALKFFFSEMEIYDGFANIYVDLGYITAEKIQKPEKKMPYYVTMYGLYPIYEPAEGGYYYNGVQILESYGFQTFRAARKFLRKKYKELYRNPEQEVKGAEWHCTPNHQHFGVDGKYVGKGWFIQLERKQGISVRGWVPYS